jgi:hypothetical protein
VGVGAAPGLLELQAVTTAKAAMEATVPAWNCIRRIIGIRWRETT